MSCENSEKTPEDSAKRLLLQAMGKTKAKGLNRETFVDQFHLKQSMKYIRMKDDLGEFWR